jgi:Tfp pilus assembly protein PilX
MVAGVGLLNTQFHQTTNQEQEEKAFEAADAGLHYTLWMLNKANVAPATLPGQTVTQQVTDPASNETIGSFTLTFTVQPVNGFNEVTVTSLGRDLVMNRRQTIVGKVQEYDLGGGTRGYFIKSWDHQP